MKSILTLLFILMSFGVPSIAFADPDKREEKREERGRSDESQDKRECREENGAVGKDMRDCKQEQVRDGVRGKQGERLGGDDKD